MLYFAFGSNMDLAQMRSRIGEFENLGEAWLVNWTLVFSGHSITRGGPVANVIPARGEAVLGVLYKIPAHAVAEMDRYEGYPQAYDRKVVTVDHQGTSRRATIYLKPANLQQGRPPNDYLRGIVKAYKRLGYKMTSPWLPIARARVAKKARTRRAATPAVAARPARQSRQQGRSASSEPYTIEIIPANAANQRDGWVPTTSHTTKPQAAKALVEQHFSGQVPARIVHRGRVTDELY